MGKNRDTPETDSDLFLRSVGNVKPIRHDQAISTHPKPAPIPVNSRSADERRKKHAASGTVELPAGGGELFFKRPGLQQRVLRKLRRGQFTVERELDLHGMTAVTAEQRLMRFLEECRMANCRCVMIIHGKGHGSKNRQAILKYRLDGWLRQQEGVLAFCSARASDGGSGAVYVLIRQN